MPEAGLRIAGVLGGIGSGKSTAAAFLATAGGGRVVDADRHVAELLRDPQVLAALEVAAGEPLRDAAGGLDRARLAALIFRDPAARERVEGVLHPRTRKKTWEALAALEAERPGALAVLDVPLLLEKGLHLLCDFLVFVDAPDALRRERATARHGWTAEEWARREAVQAPLAVKRARADAILSNDAGPERLRERCAALEAALRSLPVRPLRQRWTAPDSAPSAPAPPRAGSR